MLQILLAEKPEATFGSGCGFKQPLFLIKANGVRCQPGFSRHLPDLDSMGHVVQAQAYTLESTPESSPPPFHLRLMLVEVDRFTTRNRSDRSLCAP